MASLAQQCWNISGGVPEEALWLGIRATQLQAEGNGAAPAADSTPTLPVVTNDVPKPGRLEELALELAEAAADLDRAIAEHWTPLKRALEDYRHALRELPKEGAEARRADAGHRRDCETPQALRTSN